jgi:hypothetical protein
MSLICQQDRIENSYAALTVKTAKATVPMMKPSELLSFSRNGGFAPCCVNDDSQFGRAIERFKGAIQSF